MKKSTWKIIICFLLLVFLFPISAYAKSDGYQPILDDQVILGGTFSLGKGEILEGNIVVIGGVIQLDEASLVKGDIVGIGSSATVAGEVTQSLVAIGGVVTLKDTAIIRGDLIAPGSVMKKAENAKVLGQVVTSSGPIKLEGGQLADIPALPEPETVPDEPEFPPPGIRTSMAERVAGVFAPAIRGLWFMFRLFAISAVAVVLALLVPEQSKRASGVIMSEPVLSGGMGLLTLMIAIPLMIILTITIILIPVTLLVVFLLIFGLFFGWIAIGQEIGRRIEVALGQEWSGAIQAGTGTFILTFLVSGLNFVFWDIVGWMIGILVASVGLGAVLLTRFGTHEYITKKAAIPAAPKAEVISPPVVEVVTEAPEPVVVTPEIVEPTVKTKTRARKSDPKTESGVKPATKKTTARKKTAPAKDSGEKAEME